MTDDAPHLHAALNEHLRRLLAMDGPHEDKSRELLKLAANYRAMVLKETLVVRYGLTVAGGPFAGLRLPGVAAGGCLLPKLLGCYEAPLHPHVRAAAGRGYGTIVNIGCAEGYYAVGLARLMPAARVFAYDTDPRARELCRQTAALNGVADRVTVGGRFDGADFARFAGALVVCDIEGGERDLLDPAAFPALRDIDLIVELHDFLDPALSGLILDRFAASHDAVVVDLAERTLRLPEPFPALREIDGLVAAWEMRPGASPWAVLTRRDRPPG